MPLKYSRTIVRFWFFLSYVISIPNQKMPVEMFIFLIFFTKLILINFLFSVPSVNVATIEKSACVQDGVSRSRHALLNGDTKNYDWDSGYTCHQLGSGAIVVQLGQPFVIDSMK